MGKLRPLNVLFVVVVAVAEGGKDTLPPTGQASSCHVQQMQPKLSKKNHNSRVRPRQKMVQFGLNYWNNTDMSHNKGKASEK